MSVGFLVKDYCDSKKQAELYDNLIEAIEDTDDMEDAMSYSCLLYTSMLDSSPVNVEATNDLPYPNMAAFYNNEEQTLSLIHILYQGKDGFGHSGTEIEAFKIQFLI